MLLGSFARFPLVVRIQGRVISVLKFRTGCTALRERADHRGISLMSPTLGVFDPL